MQTYQVEVSISQQEHGLWNAEVPALPNCFVDAETLEEAIEDIREAAHLFMASYYRHGDSLPPELRAIPLDMPKSLRITVSLP